MRAGSRAGWTRAFPSTTLSKVLTCKAKHSTSHWLVLPYTIRTAHTAPGLARSASAYSRRSASPAQRIHSIIRFVREGHSRQALARPIIPPMTTDAILDLETTVSEIRKINDEILVFSSFVKRAEPVAPAALNGAGTEIQSQGESAPGAA